MARIRSIHPGFFTDEAVMGLSCEAQIFLVGLWTEADDQGVFAWKPPTLRARLRPCRDGSVEPILAELAQAGCIRRYEHDGRSFGAIRNFCKYQRPRRPNNRFVVPPELRTWVGLAAAGTEPAGVEEGAVPSKSESTGVEAGPLPPKSELGAQMEEEGWRREDEGWRREDGGGKGRRENQNNDVGDDVSGIDRNFEQNEIKPVEASDASINNRFPFAADDSLRRIEEKVYPDELYLDRMLALEARATALRRNDRRDRNPAGSRRQVTKPCGKPGEGNGNADSLLRGLENDELRDLSALELAQQGVVDDHLGRHGECRDETQGDSGLSVLSARIMPRRGARRKRGTGPPRSSRRRTIWRLAPRKVWLNESAATRPTGTAGAGPPRAQTEGRDAGERQVIACN